MNYIITIFQLKYNKHIYLYLLIINICYKNNLYHLIMMKYRKE